MAKTKEKNGYVGKGKWVPGKGLKGAGRNAIRRQSREERDIMLGISNRQLRRLAKKAGVRRLSHKAYERMRQKMQKDIEQLAQYAVAITSPKKTVTTRAMLYALKKKNRTVYACEVDKY